VFLLGAVMKKEFDLVVYGATGFVGQQAAAYIAARAPKAFRWAIAGRSEGKLKALQSKVAPSAAVLVADAQDAEGLQRIAQSAKVVMSCAGPYAIHGSKLLAACVQSQAHYCDITGETPWVKQMIDQHHSAAKAAKLRIVPGCGFDSIPSDLGVHLLQREMQVRHGLLCTDIKAAFTVAGGGFNGGTLASLMNILATGQRAAFENPYLLNPEGSEPPERSTRAADADPIAPHHDKDFQAWLGPFIMGPINTRVVRRASALRGQDLRYQEYMRFGKGAGAALFAAGFSSGSMATMGALQFAPVRALAQRFIPQPGEGPSEAAMAKGFFKIDLIGRAANGRKLRAIISDKADAGNRATCKMLCESALALALDAEQLPKNYGVIPPSLAMGDVLPERLLAAGMRVEVQDFASV
jgi:short subunit dehydrogenase-like uncharacterized protein